MLPLILKNYRPLWSSFIAIPILVITAISVAATDLNKIETYLNSIQTLKAKFNQINYDGSQSSGIIWLEKPGKLRLEYKEPSSLLIISNSGFTAVIDKLSNTPPQRYLTKNIPLSFLIEKTVNLSKKEFSFSFTESRDTINLNIFKAANQSKSELSIKFIMSPFTISGWTVQTPTGENITVDLLEPEFNIEIQEEWVFGIGGEIQNHMKKISE